MYTIDIDTGGTFTDGYIVSDDGELMVKVDTTPHDLTLCFFNCIEQGARQLGMPTGELLNATRVIRFSSTIATNAAVQLSGPKIGVIVTAGHEKALYGSGPDNPAFGFVPRHLVVGIEEETGANGEIVKYPSAEEVEEKVRWLLENGARMLVICLSNSHFNPSNELKVRQIIDFAYPRHYLGAVPMLTSHHVTSIPDDALRASTAIVNAYFHRIIVHSLYKAEDLVRQSNYRYPLMIVNADFGVARVAKTKAITTYQSGPAAGVRGAHVLAGERGHANVLCIDVGGTTSDVSFLRKDDPIAADYRPINGASVAQRIPNIISFGVGGGSRIRLVEGDLTVGPDSQGAVPGPAAFGLGGTIVTPTDVWLTLGYLDPDAYLGGRKQLQPERARTVIEKAIAQPLSLDVTEAALRAKAAIESSLAAQIRDAGIIPPGAVLIETALYAVGGGAGLMAAGLAAELGLGRVYVPSMAAVFSAFGASTLDVTHSYEEIVIPEASAPDDLSRLIEAMAQRARRDMRGEGYAAEDIGFAVEVECFAGSEKVDHLPPTAVNGKLPDDVRGFVAGRVGNNGFLVLRLVATCRKPHPPLLASPGRAANADDARTGERAIIFDGRSQVAPVYHFDRLPAGSRIAGPAIIENQHTSILVPSEQHFELDEIGGGIMEV